MPWISAKSAAERAHRCGPARSRFRALSGLGRGLARRTRGVSARAQGAHHVGGGGKELRVILLAASEGDVIMRIFARRARSNPGACGRARWGRPCLPVILSIDGDCFSAGGFGAAGGFGRGGAGWRGYRRNRRGWFGEGPPAAAGGGAGTTRVRRGGSARSAPAAGSGRHAAIYRRWRCWRWSTRWRGTMRWCASAPRCRLTGCAARAPPCCWFRTKRICCARFADEVWWLDQGKLAGAAIRRRCCGAYAGHIARRVRAWGETVPASLAPRLRRGDGRARSGEAGIAGRIGPADGCVAQRRTGGGAG